MKFFRRPKEIIRIFLAIASLAIAADMCHSATEKPLDFDTQVIVYEDVNSNGKHDNTEKSIPNPLITFTGVSDETPETPCVKSKNGKVVYQSKEIYLPCPQWIAISADEDGIANVSGQVIRHYEIAVLKPCGYHSRQIPGKSFWENSPVYEVGFIPDNPRAGRSEIEFHIWFDQNQDGKRNKDEIGIKNLTVPLGVNTNFQSEDDPMTRGTFYFFDFDLMTNDAGEIKFDLGNVCEEFTVFFNSLSDDTLFTTYLSPNVRIEGLDENGKPGWFKFDSSIGTTRIDWGLARKTVNSETPSQ